MHRAGLERASLRIRPDGQHIRVHRGIDRRGDVRIRPDREINRRRQIEQKIDVRVQVQQGQHLLRRQSGAALGCDFFRGQALQGASDTAFLLSVFRSLTDAGLPGARSGLTIQQPKILA